MKVQIIQTLSILVQNLSNEVSVFYLLSNNYIKYVGRSCWAALCALSGRAAGCHTPTLAHVPLYRSCLSALL